MANCLQKIHYHITCGHRIGVVEHLAECLSTNTSIMLPYGIAPPDFGGSPSAPICTNAEFLILAFDTQCPECQTPTQQSIANVLSALEIADRHFLWRIAHASGPNAPASLPSLAARMQQRQAEYTTASTAFTSQGPIIEIAPEFLEIPPISEMLKEFNTRTLQDRKEKCGICFCPLRGPAAGDKENGSSVAVLPCGTHYYHRVCVQPVIEGEYGMATKGRCHLHNIKYRWARRLPAVSFEDPVFQRTVVAPTWGIQVSGYEPFRDPSIDIQFRDTRNWIDISKAEQLWGPVNCTILEPNPQPDFWDGELRQILIEGLEQEPLIAEYTMPDDGL